MVLVGLLVGCGNGKTAARKPQDVLAAYARAVAKGKLDAAYGMMSLEFRKRYDIKDFKRMLSANPDQVRQSVAQLSKKPRKVAIEARFKYGHGDEMKLVYEGGKWRMAGDPIAFYGQSTPREALRSFIRAVERRRYDVVLRFVPSKWTGNMTVEKLRKQWEGEKRAEIQQMLKDLKANVDAAIHEDGDTAVMAYGDAKHVRFRREDGLWKIEDPD